MRPWPGKPQRLSSALSIAEYVYNQPEMSEESNAGLHHPKLDLVAGSSFAVFKHCHNLVISENVGNLLIFREKVLDLRPKSVCAI